MTINVFINTPVILYFFFCSGYNNKAVHYYSQVPLSDIVCDRLLYNIHKGYLKSFQIKTLHQKMGFKRLLIRVMFLKKCTLFVLKTFFLSIINP